jgi:hypothetical protein
LDRAEQSRDADRDQATTPHDLLTSPAIQVVQANRFLVPRYQDNASGEDANLRIGRDVGLNERPALLVVDVLTSFVIDLLF